MQSFGGGFRFDDSSGQFVDPEGKPLDLRPQSEHVLKVLAHSMGRIISKEELFSTVWADRAVTDDSLVQCISELRKVLNDPKREVLQTLARRGYRLNPELEAHEAKNLPIIEMEPIRYVDASDGTQIAWTASGDGPPILKAPNWISHLGLELRTRIYAHFYERMGKRARIVRFDQRGNGMSDWDIPPLSLDAIIEDMRAVADAAGLGRFMLYGLSQGVAYSVAFAARYPERVLGIIGRGGYARGNIACGRPERKKAHETALAVIRGGWEMEDSTYRRFFTSRLMPSGSPELLEEFDELQRQAVPERNVEAFLEFISRLDVRKEAAKVQAPALIIHAYGDQVAAFAEGELLATLMPNARFVPLDGRDHSLVPGSVAYTQGLAEIEAFLERHGMEAHP